MLPEEIKKEIQKQLSAVLQEGKQIDIDGIAEDAFGHSGGALVEAWLKQRLAENGWAVYYPNEFLSELFMRIGKDEKRILQKISENWWGSLLLTRKQIEEFLAGQPVTRWQQEGADLVILYGSDIFRESENVILLNAKSHNILRKSRAPNIMSAQRLLEFLHETIVRKDYKEKLEKLQLWFVGVGYHFIDSKARILEINIKDLFRLDTSQVPQINFDAAIQIQWHVSEMVEKEQTKVEFIQNLSATFLQQWRKHSQGKERKYSKLVSDITDALSK